MNNIAAFVRPIFVVCAMSLSAVAGPQVVFELEKAERVSDLVVVVDVLGTRESGTVEKIINNTGYLCNRGEATCRVLEVFKGQSTKGQQIKVAFLQGNDVPIALEGLRQSENAVLFLKIDHGELFNFADDQCSKIALDEFVPSITQPGQSLRENIGKQLIANLEDKDAKKLQNAILWANIIGYPIPEGPLDRLSESTNVDVAVVALVPLVQQGKKQAIMHALDILFSVQQADRNGIEALAWALEGSARTLSVQQANRLAASGDALISRIGLRILRTVGDESSVAILLKGLDAADKDAQYSAVVGLCRVSGQEGPSLREFMKDRDEEIVKWKTWGKEKERKK